MPGNETFSRHDLLRALGDEDAEGASELLALFQLEARRILGEVAEAVTRCDDGAVARAAHTLSSVAANVGGREARRLATALEEAARLRDRPEVERLAAALVPEVEALRRAFAACVSALGAGPVRS